MEFAGKYAAKKVFRQQVEKNKHKKQDTKYDPYFEMVPNSKGKLKKVKRRIPDCLPENEAELLAKVKTRAYHWDSSLFDFAGTRFGWGSVVGLLPEIGDVIDLAVSCSIYRNICKSDVHLGSVTHARMISVIFADFIVGLVPFVGDYFDAMLKCNTFNVMLFEKALVEHYGEHLTKEQKKRQSWEPFANDPDFPQDHVYENSAAPPPYSAPPKPEPARPANSQRGGWREWLGSGQQPERNQDPELGHQPRR